MLVIILAAVTYLYCRTGIFKKEVFWGFDSLGPFLGAKRSPGYYFLFLEYNGEYIMKKCDYHIQSHFLNIHTGLETTIYHACQQGLP